MLKGSPRNFVLVSWIASDKTLLEMSGPKELR